LIVLVAKSLLLLCPLTLIFSPNPLNPETISLSVHSYQARDFVEWGLRDAIKHNTFIQLPDLNISTMISISSDNKAYLGNLNRKVHNLAIIGETIAAIGTTASEAFKLAKEKNPDKKVSIAYIPTAKETVTLL